MIGKLGPQHSRVIPDEHSILVQQALLNLAVLGYRIVNDQGKDCTRTLVTSDRSWINREFDRWHADHPRTREQRSAARNPARHRRSTDAA